MPIICSGCTSITAFPTAYTCTEPQEVSGLGFIFLHCDLTFTDITDTAEWTTAQTAGDVHVMPIGTWAKEKAQQTQTTYVHGGRTKVISKIEGTNFPFESNEVSTDGSHFKYLRDILDPDGWTIIPFDTREFLYVSTAYADVLQPGYSSPITVANENPGHPFQWSDVPDTDSDNSPTGLERISMTPFITTPTIIGGVKITGLLTALGVDVPN